MPADPQYPTWEQANQLANLYSKYIDEPNVPSDAQYTNPTYGRDPRYHMFADRLEAIRPGFGNPQQFGVLQNPPQYRGIRLLLPESTASIPGPAREDSYKSMQLSRMKYFNDLHQMFLGEMIRRGYPVLGGTGQQYGQERGFNPIGFGQR